MEPLLKLTPFLQTTVWGSNRWGNGPIGESWVVSNHPKGSCLVDGVSLRELIQEGDLPFLVKFIDTLDNLSVQVHPGDEFAKKIENSLGKTECWIILSAKPGAGIYLGLKENIGEKEFKMALEAGVNMSSYLNFYSVSKGDFYFVPAGTPHAIGKDVFLAEVQQSSGITYRVWDWNRVGLDGKPRELHIEKALKVIDFKKNSSYKKEKIFDHSGESLIVEHDCFSLKLINLKKNQETEVNLRYNRVGGLICLEGHVDVTRDKKGKSLKEMESLLAPLGFTGSVKIKSKEDSILIWVC
jgi:mannose-6-phosphate isomerase